MQLHEVPLIILTTLVQSAIGAYWLCALAVLTQAGGVAISAKLEKWMFFIVAFAGIGFIASSFHLGSPLRALNAFNRLGSAPLSNEGFSGVLFIGCTGMAWLLAMVNYSAKLRKGLLIGGLALSVLLFYCMNSFYMINTVPTWYNWTTPAAFFATTLLGGGVFANVLYKAAGIQSDNVACWSKTPIVFVGVGLVLAAIVTLNLLVMLPQIQTSLQVAANKLPEMACLQTLRFILLGVGAGLIAYQAMSKNHSTALALIILAIVVFGEMIGRNLFYGLHMTVGLV